MVIYKPHQIIPINYLTKKQNRGLIVNHYMGSGKTFIGLGFLSLLVASALALTAFEDTLVFFYSPSDIKEKSINTDKQIRIGGLVKNGSLRKSKDGITVRFEVTDFNHSIPAIYRGSLPDLFRENQGVVAEGHLSKGIFRAKTILAKQCSHAR